jgi:hypothetical protein
MLLAPLLAGLALAAPRSPTFPHLSCQLQDAADLHAKGHLAGWARRHPELVDATGLWLTLEVGDAAAAQTALERLGMPAALAVPVDGGAWLQVRVPFTAMPALEQVPTLRWVRLPDVASPKGGRDAGAIVSEGLASIFQDGDWYEARWRGRGIRVAIADVGFSGVEDLTGEELPRRVRMSNSDQSSGSDHGVAVAEVVHDLAPRAQLRLFPFLTDVEFLDTVDTLAGERVDLVNGSIGFDNTWHADGTSPYTRAVDELSDSGVLWVAAAGNEGTRYLAGPLTDEDGDGDVEIDGVEGVWVPVVGGTADLSLRWSEGMRDASLDLDLQVEAEDGTPCGSSTEPQDGAPSAPLESVSASCPGNWAWARVRQAAGDPRDLEDILGWLYVPWGIEEAGAPPGVGTLTLPGDTRRGLSVGVCDRSAGRAPAYASYGPTDDGRTKPDVCAPDGVSTSTYGPEGFLGTSAATAHGTGMAALVMDAERLDGEPAAVISTIEALAEDLGDTGEDPVFGAGALNAGPPPEGCHCATARAPVTFAALLLPLALVGYRRRETPDETAIRAGQPVSQFDRQLARCGVTG